MGRGAPRSKGGGMSIMKDAERKIVHSNINMSLFEFLQEGCFEKILISYCSNRLNDYSCIHWLDPETIYSLNGADEENKTDTEFEICVHEREKKQFQILQVAQIFSPIILSAALLFSIILIVAVKRISVKLHPLLSYIFYLTLFDIMDIVIRGGDHLIQTFARLKVIYAAQILSRSSCQMIPFAYNLVKHCHMTLYIALTIDNWRFVKQPKLMNEKYRSEWIRNALIVITAVLITVNSQFFWTFDVTQNDNFFLYNRFVKSTFECSFSKTWPLKQIFTEYVWPLLDHLAGEILPSFVCIWLGFRYFYKTPTYENGLGKYIINVDLLYQMNYSISVVSTLFGLFTLPRLSYFSFKYFYYFYSLKVTNKMSKDSLKLKTDFNIFRSQKFDNEGIYLQYIEYIVNNLQYVFIVVKFWIFFTKVDLIRDRVSSLWLFCGNRKSGDSTQNSMKRAETDEPLITFKHRSVTFKNQTESVTLCSYTM